MPPFEAMAFKNDSERSVNASWGGIRLGLYARHLRRWLTAFPKDQLHFVSGEGLVGDPASEMAAVEAFLGLSPFIGPAHFVLEGTPKGFPCIAGPALHCLGASKGRPHPAIADSDETALRDFFRPHNDLLYRLAGRDFGWP